METRIVEISYKAIRNSVAAIGATALTIIILFI
jgi:hypothetical protein